MPTLVWDKPGKRVYESGLDKGVLYLPDGSAVPWNGLTSIIEKFDKSTVPIYFDGMKIQDLVVLGDFAATMKAITYPDEFIGLEGLGSLKRGIFVGDQVPQTFGLCYRTQVGNDLSDNDADHKIHVIYNVTAIPSQKAYASVTTDPSLVEFEWNIVAVPEEIPGLRPSAHIIIDTRNLDPFLLEDIEAKLYGSKSLTASLIPMSDLITFIREWYRVKIIDNGDGTWTATATRDGFIQFCDNAHDQFRIVGVNAVYIDDVTFRISDTTDVGDIPEIEIHDNGDGTWTATTDHENLIVMTDATTFEIFDANATFVGSDSYVLSDTTTD